MCFVSTPKLNTNPPPVQYMHNAYLDGSTDDTGLTIGRNSLVVMGSSNAAMQGTGVAPTSDSGVTAGAGTGNPLLNSGIVGGPGGGGNTGSNGGVNVPTMGGAAAGAVPPNFGQRGAVRPATN